MANCKHAKDAHDTGYSDALFDGFESELECYCLECQEAYSKGWEAGAEELEREEKERIDRELRSGE